MSHLPMCGVNVGRTHAVDFDLLTSIELVDDLLLLRHGEDAGDQRGTNVSPAGCAGIHEVQHDRSSQRHQISTTDGCRRDRYWLLEPTVKLPINATHGMLPFLLMRYS